MKREWGEGREALQYEAREKVRERERERENIHGAVIKISFPFQKKRFN